MSFTSCSFYLKSCSTPSVLLLNFITQGSLVSKYFYRVLILSYSKLVIFFVQNGANKIVVVVVVVIVAV